MDVITVSLNLSVEFKSINGQSIEITQLLKLLVNVNYIYIHKTKAYSK